MSEFIPACAHWQSRVEQSFNKQKMMGHIGAYLGDMEPGAVDVVLPHEDGVTQQHGFFHGGAISTIADVAAGYAAFSLMPAEKGVLSVEFKVNFLRPGIGEHLIARGRVLKPGNMVTTAKADVFGVSEGKETLVATGLFTMFGKDGFVD